MKTIVAHVLELSPKSFVYVLRDRVQNPFFEFVFNLGKNGTGVLLKNPSPLNRCYINS